MSQQVLLTFDRWYSQLDLGEAGVVEPLSHCSRALLGDGLQAVVALEEVQETARGEALPAGKDDVVRAGDARLGLLTKPAPSE